MTDAIKQSLRDSKAARWTALVILSFTMFAGYMFTEIISPIKPLLESTYGWTSSDFGTVVSAYGWFNVFFFALIFVGILLDKFGIRFSTLSSAGIMVIGALLKYYAFSGTFDPQATILGMNLSGFLCFHRICYFWSRCGVCRYYGFQIRCEMV